MKSQIIITKADGSEEEMNLICTFNIKGNNYMIYSDNNTNYYVGKYKELDNIVIDTQLTPEELMMCNKVFEEMQNDQ